MHRQAGGEGYPGSRGRDGHHGAHSRRRGSNTEGGRDAEAADLGEFRDPGDLRIAAGEAHLYIVALALSDPDGPAGALRAGGLGAVQGQRRWRLLRIQDQRGRHRGPVQGC